MIKIAIAKGYLFKEANVLLKNVISNYKMI